MAPDNMSMFLWESSWTSKDQAPDIGGDTTKVPAKMDSQAESNS